MAAWPLAPDPAVADPLLVHTPDALAQDRRARWHGIGLLALGGVAFAAMGAMAKGASTSLPTMELVAGRSLVTWAVTEAMRRRMRVPLQFFDVPILASRTIAGFVAIACYFWALRVIPLGDAVLLNNASPPLTALGAVWFLREPMTRTKGLALVASVLGIWLLVGQRTEGLGLMAGLIGAFSALASAWALVSLKVATRRNRSVMVVWALAAVSTLGSLLVALVTQDWVWPDPHESLLLLGTGLAATAAQLLMTSGYRRLEASEAALFGFLTPVLSMVAGAVFFAETPTSRSVAGGALILLSGVAVAVAGDRAHARAVRGAS